jgi:hypothetical protein
MKVALISAPFADRREPSLALGLFQALLKQLQIESKQFYLSLIAKGYGKKYCDLALWQTGWRHARFTRKTTAIAP